MKVFNKFLWMEDMRGHYRAEDHKALCKMVLREPNHWVNLCHGKTKAELDEWGFLYIEEWFANADYSHVKRGDSYAKS